MLRRIVGTHCSLRKRFLVPCWVPSRSLANELKSRQKRMHEEFSQLLPIPPMNSIHEQVSKWYQDRSQASHVSDQSAKDIVDRLAHIYVEGTLKDGQDQTSMEPICESYFAQNPKQLDVNVAAYLALHTWILMGRRINDEDMFQITFNRKVPDHLDASKPLLRLLKQATALMQQQNLHFPDWMIYHMIQWMPSRTLKSPLVLGNFLKLIVFSNQYISPLSLNMSVVTGMWLSRTFFQVRNLVDRTVVRPDYEAFSLILGYLAKAMDREQVSASTLIRSYNVLLNSIAQMTRLLLHKRELARDMTAEPMMKVLIQVFDQYMKAVPELLSKTQDKVIVLEYNTTVPLFRICGQLGLEDENINRLATTLVQSGYLSEKQLEELYSVLITSHVCSPLVMQWLEQNQLSHQNKRSVTVAILKGHLTALKAGTESEESKKHLKDLQKFLEDPVHMEQEASLVLAWYVTCSMNYNLTRNRVVMSLFQEKFRTPNKCTTEDEFNKISQLQASLTALHHSTHSCHVIGYAMSRQLSVVPILVQVLRQTQILASDTMNRTDFAVDKSALVYNIHYLISYCLERVEKGSLYKATPEDAMALCDACLSLCQFILTRKVPTAASLIPLTNKCRLLISMQRESLRKNRVEAKSWRQFSLPHLEPLSVSVADVPVDQGDLTSHVALFKEAVESFQKL